MISSMRGRELPGFLNYKVFQPLLKRTVKDWKTPAFELLQQTKSIVEEVCDAIVSEPRAVPARGPPR